MDVIEQVVQLIVNNGLGVACVFYMIYFHHTSLRDIQNTQNDMTNILGIMKTELEDIRNEIKKG